MCTFHLDKSLFIYNLISYYFNINMTKSRKTPYHLPMDT